MNIDYIFKNNERWINERLATDANYFNKLSSGQEPQLLYIGCSDSRVSAEEIMGLKPGEVFVHRNISNIVGNIDLNTQSVVDFAVKHLHVKHIVVCGHYQCGGVKAAMQAKDLGLLNPWLRIIRDVYRLHDKELNAITDPEKRYDRLVELNVLEQCINLIKIASVQEAYNNGEMHIHGWVMNIKSGKLIDLKIDMEKEMEHIKEVYDLGK
ncbi:MAG TPA: carbonic anhydrase [Saprospiraceae bacterium]|jgi:carbonic anhydrase|nr:carbonic anhydrase [Saprospiraceae bacterium]HMT76591.1 carbonic anhydrase [Saprospiraceae bacterium]